jgi:hypothetical protein
MLRRWICENHEKSVNTVSTEIRIGYYLFQWNLMMSVKEHLIIMQILKNNVNPIN